MEKNIQLSVSCVIPAHNEEENIERVVDHIFRFKECSNHFYYELVLVNDNSGIILGQ